jgi:transposase
MKSQQQHRADAPMLPVKTRRMRKCEQCSTAAIRLARWDGHEICASCLFAEWVEHEIRDHRQVIAWCYKNGTCIYCGDPWRIESAR